MKPPSVAGVVLSAGTSVGATTTLVLQRYGRAYLKKRFDGSVDALLPISLSRSTTFPKLALPLLLPTPTLLPEWIVG